MALILHIETAASACSVALSQNSEAISLKESFAGKPHAEKLTVFIEEVFRESGIRKDEIDAVAISKGPGSYTGLRIGAAAAKGLCYALDKPLISVNTLLSMANLFILENREFLNGEYLLCPMLDARRMEVYTAVLNSSMKAVKQTMTMVIAEESFREELGTGKMVFFGEGAGKCKNVIAHPNAMFKDELRMSAKGLISPAEQAFTEGHFEDVAYFEPLYLKDFIPGVRKSQKMY